MAEENKPAVRMDKLEMAAILLLSLGETHAAKILQHMGPKEVQRVGGAMATLANVRNDQVEQVMVAMLAEVESQTGLGIGSDDYIKATLVKALGADKAGGLIDRILMGGNTTGLDTLKWMDSRSVSEIIRYEHPQIQAIVLAYLDPDHSAQILTHMVDPRVRQDLLMRVAALDVVQPAALQELNDILENQFSGAQTQAAAMGGTKVAAEIMNNVDSVLETEIMEAISEVDEELAVEIQDLMFVFDNLSDVDDRGIQALLREISSEVLITALKGAEEIMQEKIFKNMSKRAAELLRDDLEAKGPVRVSDVEAAQREILTVARKMAESGDIVLGGGGEQMV
ncbi:MAG: flagellar motor switch protein FliG [Pseudomonadales bacterium]|nr:flagellar motor switch protein FliG [Pseudomonadales bacterium]